MDKKLDRETLERILGDGLPDVPVEEPVTGDAIREALLRLEDDVPWLSGLADWSGEETRHVEQAGGNGEAAREDRC